MKAYVRHCHFTPTLKNDATCCRIRIRITGHSERHNNGLTGKHWINVSTKQPIESLTIKGFKSIRNLERLQFGRLNVLIGSNGSGKSNLVSFFRMLTEMVEGRLQVWVSQQGGADRVLSFGLKETTLFESSIVFGSSAEKNKYQIVFGPTVDGSFVFSDERLFYHGPNGNFQFSFGSGHKEALVKTQRSVEPVSSNCYCAISNWKVYHFHDTGDTAGMKRLCLAHDNDYFRSDASNLAAFLFRLQDESPDVYEQIRKTVRLAIPFFDDFVLKPQPLKTGEEQIRLLWRQLGSDYALWPSQLSDGSIRFICLVTALMQPDPPSTIIIDEPELGLHPYAITLLASLLRSASTRMQVVVSTQSVPLVNEFSIDDLIVVERKQGESVFCRYREREFKDWLEEYTVGELWQKNILGGRPCK